MSVNLAEPRAAGTLGDWLDPARTALLIIDMQVDFAAPDGALGLAGVDLSTVGAALDRAERLGQAARAVGAPVVFVGLQTAASTDSPAWALRARRRGDDPNGAALCRAGAVGAAFHGPQPRAGDLVVAKTRYSAFFRTELDDLLKRRGIDTLVVCGLTTECCVDCSVRDAFHLEYQVFLAPDACAAYEAGLHEGAIRSLELNCAMLVDTAAVEAAWRGGGEAHG